MRIRAGQLSPDELSEACNWIEYSVGWSRNEISDTFTVELEMPGSVRLTFDRFLRDEDGELRIIADTEVAKEPFTIFVSERLGWLQRYLERTRTKLG